MRYQTIGDWTIEFASHICQNTQSHQVLVRHWTSRLLVRANVTHETVLGNVKWDGMMFETSYFNH
jgi:hypothetical protein